MVGDGLAPIDMCNHHDDVSRLAYIRNVQRNEKCINELVIISSSYALAPIINSNTGDTIQCKSNQSTKSIVVWHVCKTRSIIYWNRRSWNYDRLATQCLLYAKAIPLWYNNENMRNYRTIPM